MLCIPAASYFHLHLRSARLAGLCFQQGRLLGSFRAQGSCLCRRKPLVQLRGFRLRGTCGPLGQERAHFSFFLLEAGLSGLGLRLRIREIFDLNTDRLTTITLSKCFNQSTLSCKAKALLALRWKSRKSAPRQGSDGEKGHYHLLHSKHVIGGCLVQGSPIAAALLPQHVHFPLQVIHLSGQILRLLPSFTISEAGAFFARTAARRCCCTF
jgi:hypothetical protein